MTTEEFYNEVLNSSLCPAGFDVIYKDFKKYQQDGLKTLNEVHRICEKNGIRYVLGYGSLLGAIRDNGVIPWDYDVDIFIPYEDKDRFISVLDNDLSSEFYYECPENCIGFPSFMIRVSPVGYDTLAVHVDVFYIVGTSTEKDEQDRMGEQIKSLCLNRVKKLSVYKKIENRNLKTFIIIYIAKVKRFYISIAEIDRKLKKICTQYDPSNSNVSMIICSVYDDVFRYPTDLLWDTELFKTEVGEFRVSKTYDRILTQLYGDYHKPLSLKVRISETIHYYHLLKHLDFYYKGRLLKG